MSESPSDVEKHELQQHHRQFANPAPLGLFSFATSILVLSLYNTHARGITVPNVIVGLALFYGGLAQFIAGMWEFAAGNTYGATSFTSFGASWLSFGTIFIPGSGIPNAYANAAPGMEDNALGIWHLAWMIVAFLFFIASLRKSIGLSVVFFFLTTTLLVLSVGHLNKNVIIIKTGGYFGIVTALIAYYLGLAELLTPADLFTLPTGKCHHD